MRYIFPRLTHTTRVHISLYIHFFFIIILFFCLSSLELIILFLSVPLSFFLHLRLCELGLFMIWPHVIFISYVSSRALFSCLHCVFECVHILLHIQMQLSVHVWTSCMLSALMNDMILLFFRHFHVCFNEYIELSFPFFIFSS